MWLLFDGTAKRRPWDESGELLLPLRRTFFSLFLEMHTPNHLYLGVRSTAPRTRGDELEPCTVKVFSRSEAFEKAKKQAIHSILEQVNESLIGGIIREADTIEIGSSAIPDWLLKEALYALRSEGWEASLHTEKKAIAVLIHRPIAEPAAEEVPAVNASSDVT